MKSLTGRRISFALLISIGAISAHAQGIEWVAHLEGAYTESAHSVCTDIDGNTYVTGRASGMIINGTPSGSVSGTYDIYLAKFDAVGSLVWVVTPGGGDQMDFNEADRGRKVVYDSTNEVLYLAGSYQGTTNGPAVFGPGIQISGRGAFIAKYDLDGTCIWMRSTNNGWSSDIAIDAAGNVFVKTYSLDSMVDSTTYQGPPTITVANGPSMAKYTSSGQLLWAKSLGHNVDGSMVICNNRLFFCGGASTSDALLLQDPITGDNGGNMILVAALDTSCSTVFWTETVQGSVAVNALDLALTPSGELLFSGVFSDSLFLTSDTIVVSNTITAPLYGLVDTTGTLLWVRHFVADVSSGVTVSMAPDSTFYIGFDFSGSVDLPTTSMTAMGARDVAAIRCEPDGDPIGAIHYGSMDVNSFDVHATPDNGVVIASYFGGTIDFGNSQVITGAADVFIAKSGMVTGIQSNRALGTDQLHIYANPNDGTCTVDLPSSLQWTDDLVLNIHDTEGRLVQSIPVGRGSSNMALDIRAQAKGSYFLELTDGQQRYAGTIVFE